MTYRETLFSILPSLITSFTGRDSPSFCKSQRSNLMVRLVSDFCISSLNCKQGMLFDRMLIVDLCNCNGSVRSCLRVYFSMGGLLWKV